MDSRARKMVGWWLFIGCCMVFFQVIVGGVTRLTDSGLSITEWKPIKGIVPPLNQGEWQAEFDLYKEKVQYKTINEGMTLEEFKWIYFWEYFHRFWARFMGFVFAIPFAFFVVRKWFDRKVAQKFAVLFLWGGLIGLYGWIMVKNGLTGVYVPPVNLSIHLLLALGLFGYLVYMTVSVFRPETFEMTNARSALSFLYIILFVLFLQIFLGGMVSGMRAGLAYPTWPDMNGQWVPAALFTEKATLQGFTTYNAQDFWGRTFIQFFHRLTAYVLFVLVFVFYFRYRNHTTDKIFKTGIQLLPVAVLLQVCLGVLTVINCVGKIPVSLGVFHQIGAMILLAVTVFVIFHVRNSNSPTA